MIHLVFLQGRRLSALVCRGWWIKMRLQLKKDTLTCVQYNKEVIQLGLSWA